MLKQPPDHEKLIEEAEAWIVKLRSDEVSEDDKLMFSSWLNASDNHVKAFDEALAFWESLSLVSCIDESSSTSSPDGLSLNRWIDPILDSTWFHVKSWQIAAALCLALSYSLITFNWVGDSSAPTTANYTTAKGERLTVVLDDGSNVELNTNTTLEVTYTEKKRTLNLRSGEAYFSVSHDENRPFIVHFKGGSATAIGTAFNVFNDAFNTSVTVTEGIVDVRETADLAVPRPDAKRVKEAQQVSISQRGVGPVRNISTERSLAWRDGTIVFRDTPLYKALEELNRYLDKPASVQSSEIDGLKISGTFSLKNPSDTMDAIAEAFNLKKEATAENTLYYVITN